MDKPAEQAMTIRWGQALGLAGLHTAGPASAVPASPRVGSDEAGRPQWRTVKARSGSTEATKRRPGGRHGLTHRAPMRKVHAFDRVNRPALMFDAQFNLGGHDADAVTQQTFCQASGRFLRIARRRQQRHIGSGLRDRMGGTRQPRGAVSTQHSEPRRPERHGHHEHPCTACQPLRTGTAKPPVAGPGG